MARLVCDGRAPLATTRLLYAVAARVGFWGRVRGLRPNLQAPMRVSLALAAAAAVVAATCAYHGALIGQATTAAHGDPSRRAVGWTAFLVAFLRAAETERPGALIRDDVARALFAPRGPAPLAWRAALVLWRWYLARDRADKSCRVAGLTRPG